MGITITAHHIDADSSYISAAVSTATADWYYSGLTSRADAQQVLNHLQNQQVENGENQLAYFQHAWSGPTEGYFEIAFTAGQLLICRPFSDGSGFTPLTRVNATNAQLKISENGYYYTTETHDAATDNIENSLIQTTDAAAQPVLALGKNLLRLIETPKTSWTAPQTPAELAETAQKLRELAVKIHQETSFTSGNLRYSLYPLPDADAAELTIAIRSTHPGNDSDHDGYTELGSLNVTTQTLQNTEINDETLYIWGIKEPAVQP